MSLLQQMNDWSNKHHPKWLVALRVTLGLCLFIKGFEFIENQAALRDLIFMTSLKDQANWLETIIPWIHLLGGSLIVVGLLTRLSVLINIPILVGAVFLVNVKIGFHGSDLLFSIIVLFLLIFFLIEGAGPVSLDHYFGFSGYRPEPGKSE
jgi:putative oxidoreductase